ncbi:hypothetical protein L596_005998 [Steinernema carpocapsae]|uniref:Reverse transcriptase RNase H-like domain-containing protein n=1 Tax=Steinernema carpocapsae TaxID=34508 RepID=A0A4U8V285_STECR|nr:hypothetical protein L596_005998 [Steinernema carpocapsae]
MDSTTRGRVPEAENGPYLTTGPRHPDFSRPFVMETDASKIAVAACLLQANAAGEEHPVSFASRPLRGPEQRYHCNEQEALAVVFGLKQFSPYTEGNGTTIVRTDNSTCCAILKNEDIPARLKRFQLAIQGFQVQLVHRKGTSNELCDFMSRFPPEKPAACALTDNGSSLTPVSLDEIREEQWKIPEFLNIMEAIASGSVRYQDTHVMEDNTLRLRPQPEDQLDQEPRLLLVSVNALS